MMKFYRLQSEDYTIDKKSKSFWTCFDSLWEAQREDIFGWICGYSADKYKWCSDSWRDTLEEHTNDEYVYNAFTKIDEWNEEKVNALWERLVDEGYEPERVTIGVSCYEEDRMGELIEYFEYHRPYNSKDMLDAYGKGYYILVFKGEANGEGLDGEDIAVFQKEIKRISVKNFVKNIK